MDDLMTRCPITNKVSYETRPEAEQGMVLTANYGRSGPPRGKLRVYRCPHCGRLHWGHAHGTKRPY